MTDALPALTAAQARAVSRRLAREYALAPIQTAENVGRSLALLVRRRLGNDLADRPIVVLAGRGETGGGGLAAARHLLNWGAWVQVLGSDPPERTRGVAAAYLRSLQALGAALAWAEEGWELPPCDLVIDAIAGTDRRGGPQGKGRELIQLANSSLAPILSLAAPSGVDADTGRLHTPHIRAAATLMIGLPTAGLLIEPARAACGDLYVGDGGIPPALYAAWGLAVAPLFGGEPVRAVSVCNGRAVLAG